MRVSTARQLLPWAPLILRLSLGIIFVAHGGQKLFGWWGGPGLSASIDALKSSLGVPAYLLLISILTEFFGGLAILFGFLTRIAAVGLGIDMFVAITRVQVINGFFLNWDLIPGRGHGYEFNLALLAMSLAVALAGPGRLALDHVLGFEDEGGV
jgi:putative oxidoreductase